jgi:hypothetical protein
MVKHLLRDAPKEVVELVNNRKLKKKNDPDDLTAGGLLRY